MGADGYLKLGANFYGGFWVHERLEVEWDAVRPLPPVAFDYAGRRSTRVPLAPSSRRRASVTA
jgi:hypothetical protein